MAAFDSRPLNPSSFSKRVNKHPALFGVPFILIMVVASYGLASFTQTRYDMHDQKVKQVTKEQELKLKKDRKKFDIREEYFRLNAQANEDWDNKRIARPRGLPEWGVPPTEPTK
ncbi:Cytochrome c oxidase assembly protein COX16 domain containing protein [Amanita muscaria]